MTGLLAPIYATLLNCETIMKTLLICHVEPAFENSFPSNLLENILDLADEFDHVINIESASQLGGDTYPELEQFQQECWIWGFDAEYYTDPDNDCGTYVEGVDYIATTGHEYSTIEEWQRELNPDDEYVLVGGAESECLLDNLEICQHLNLNVTVNRKLVF